VQAVGGGLGGRAAPVSDERALVHKMRYTNRRLTFYLLHALHQLLPAKSMDGTPALPPQTSCRS